MVSAVPELLKDAMTSTSTAPTASCAWLVDAPTWWVAT
eukprot:CAMPEP_0196731920 /NCGR_PEP_ID=MMETSP1091-20130531/11460_1 /TAXON_ID=302021 /ORGANISM="Rhodomonas sp., Strain CCMP768" /LENGTH=37 /DNA_ID= /DNA_START= /DNA_END= /DNA_ORIENTATION=